MGKENWQFELCATEVVTFDASHTFFVKLLVEIEYEMGYHRHSRSTRYGKNMKPTICVCGIPYYSRNNNFHKIVWVLQFACLQISSNRISRYRNWLIFPVDSVHCMKINIPFMICKISGSEVWHNLNDNFYH